PLGARLAPLSPLFPYTTLFRSRRWSDRIGVDGFIPDIVLLNNDLSAGLPAILVDISQPIVPPPGMGWMRRRKSGHFSHYRTLARSEEHTSELQSRENLVCRLLL